MYNEVFEALFAVLETQRIIAGEARITRLPQTRPVLAELLAANQARKDKTQTASGSAGSSGVAQQSS